MRCPTCHRHIPLLNLRRPLRLLLPRCRFCRSYTLSWVHKAAFYLLGITVIYLLIQIFFAFRGGAAQ
jgi:hypothetical protein